MDIREDEEIDESMRNLEKYEENIKGNEETQLGNIIMKEKRKNKYRKQ